MEMDLKVDFYILEMRRITSDFMFIVSFDGWLPLGWGGKILLSTKLF